MDISRWPLDKRMELPDWCFGQKWWIGDTVMTQAAADKYFFMSDAPPDIFVVWDVLIISDLIEQPKPMGITLCLCNEAPVAGNISVLTRLLRQLGTSAELHQIHTCTANPMHLGPMKTIVEANNQGIGGVITVSGVAGAVFHTIGVLVSSIPKEVPDWVVSGLAGMR